LDDLRATLWGLGGLPHEGLPGRIYASQSSGWFGQVVQRSSDGGQTFETVGNNFTYDGPPGEHLYFDGSSKPFSFSRVWHLEPSPHHRDVVYAGVEDAALFRSEDGGMTWSELTGLRRHPSAAPAPEECAPTPFFSTSPTRPLPSRCWSPSRRLESFEAAIPAPRGAW
jgi:hypothetical protein